MSRESLSELGHGFDKVLRVPIGNVEAYHLKAGVLVDNLFHELEVLLRCAG